MTARLRRRPRTPNADSTDPWQEKKLLLNLGYLQKNRLKKNGAIHWWQHLHNIYLVNDETVRRLTNTQFKERLSSIKLTHVKYVESAKLSCSRVAVTITYIVPHIFKAVESD